MGKLIFPMSWIAIVLTMRWVNFLRVWCRKDCAILLTSTLGMLSKVIGAIIDLSIISFHFISCEKMLMEFLRDNFRLFHESTAIPTQTKDSLAPAGDAAPRL